MRHVLMRHLWKSFGIALGILVAVSPVVVSADLETIQERGYLIVAVKDDWRPLGFTDDHGTLSGLEIDIASRLADELFDDPSAIEFRPVPNRERIPALLNGDVDVAIAGLSITPMRQRVVNFSAPYYLDGTAFVTRNAEIQSLSDLSRRPIVLIEGSEAVAHVNYTLPSARLVGAESYLEAYTAVETGEAIAAAGDVTVLTGWVQEYPEYRLLPEVLTAEPLAIAFPKGYQYDSLRRFVDDAIEQWHEEGWLEERATYWGLP